MYQITVCRLKGTGPTTQLSLGRQSATVSAPFAARVVHRIRFTENAFLQAGFPDSCPPCRRNALSSGLRSPAASDALRIDLFSDIQPGPDLSASSTAKSAIQSAVVEQDASMKEKSRVGVGSRVASPAKAQSESNVGAIHVRGWSASSSEKKSPGKVSKSCPRASNETRAELGQKSSSTPLGKRPSSDAFTFCHTEAFFYNQAASGQALTAKRCTWPHAVCARAAAASEAWLLSCVCAGGAVV